MATHSCSQKPEKSASVQIKYKFYLSNGTKLVGVLNIFHYDFCDITIKFVFRKIKEEFRSNFIIWHNEFDRPRFGISMFPKSRKILLGSKVHPVMSVFPNGGLAVTFNHINTS